MQREPGQAGPTLHQVGPASGGRGVASDQPMRSSEEKR